MVIYQHRNLCNLHLLFDLEYHHIFHGHILDNDVFLPLLPLVLFGRWYNILLDRSYTTTNQLYQYSYHELTGPVPAAC